MLRGLLLVLLFAVAFVSLAHGHDHDHPELDEWYATLMQPDVPTSSCCGEADAYYCDDYYARDGRAYCKITDDRVVPGRPQVDIGTEIEIPTNKLKWDKSNPVGHSIVFLSRQLYVYCFVQSSGV
jgi:hypothetical protein